LNGSVWAPWPRAPVRPALAGPRRPGPPVQTEDSRAPGLALRSSPAVWAPPAPPWVLRGGRGPVGLGPPARRGRLPPPRAQQGLPGPGPPPAGGCPRAARAPPGPSSSVPHNENENRVFRFSAWRFGRPPSPSVRRAPSLLPSPKGGGFRYSAEGVPPNLRKPPCPPSRGNLAPPGPVPVERACAHPRVKAVVHRSRVRLPAGPFFSGGWALGAPNGFRRASRVPPRPQPPRPMPARVSAPRTSCPSQPPPEDPDFRPARAAPRWISPRLLTSLPGRQAQPPKPQTTATGPSYISPRPPA